MRYPTIMPSPVHAPASKPILSIKVAGTNYFVKTPPFPNKVQRNLLSYIRVQRENALLMNMLR
jgi:hypothetical protein